MRTTPSRTPKVTMPRMIQMTTKWPEQQPRPEFFFTGLGEALGPLRCLIGSLLGEEGLGEERKEEVGRGEDGGSRRGGVT